MVVKDADNENNGIKHLLCTVGKKTKKLICSLFSLLFCFGSDLDIKGLL